MPAASVIALVEELRRQQVLSPAQLEELDGQVIPGCAAPADLATELERRKLLSPFQVEQLFLGRDLVLGSYLLLEKLGEGGMGVVYKARHRLMEREVALKLVHPERLSRDDLRERFRREIRSVAKLSHPNI